MFKFRLKSLFLLGISALVIFLASSYKGVTELVYTNFLNRFLREGLSKLSGHVSFPVGDVLNIVLIFIIIAGIVYLFKNLFKTINVFHIFYKLLWFIVNSLAVIIFIYILFYGLNYYTPPLQQKIIAMYEEKYATSVKVRIDNATMVTVFKNLEQKAIESKKLMKATNEGYSVYDLQTLSQQADKGFRFISDQFPMMSGNYSPAKLSLGSSVLNYFGMDASYYMLTGEISINKNIPKIYLPFVVSKYMAYQRGAAKEDEAEFYSFLACINNASPEFKYSGYISALYNIISTLRVNDKIDYNYLMDNTNPEIKKDLELIDRYKKTYGNGENFKNGFFHTFKRLNGDIRDDNVNYQVSLLISSYYTLFSY